MNCDLVLKNNKMEDRVRKILVAKIDSLLDVSPSDAAASSKIVKTGAGYKGVLQICSAQGKFVAETATRDVNDLIKSLFRTMHRRLKKWRKVRFAAQPDVSW